MPVLKNILKSTIGVLIVLFLMSFYNNQFPIAILIPYQPLKGIVAIALIIFAYRLMDRKPRDYSKFFYNVLVRLFGDPTKKHKS